MIISSFRDVHDDLPDDDVSAAGQVEHACDAAVCGESHDEADSDVPRCVHLLLSGKIPEDSG